MRIKNYITIFMALLIISSCKKLETERITAVTTNEVSITATKIKAIGTIIDLGETGIIDHGFCWSTSNKPTLNGQVLSLGKAWATGQFESILYGFQPGTTYYLRAFVKSNNSILYGEVKSFISPTGGLQIITDSIQILSKSSIKMFSRINNIGSLVFPAFGHCWSKDSLPDISNFKKQYGNLNRDTIYTTEINSLKLDENYYTRTYIQLNDTVYFYSSVLKFKIPVIKITTDTFSINGTQAILMGTVNNFGVLPITDYGFCWSTTTSNPDYNSNKIKKGSTALTGSYTVSLMGIIQGSTYYYRAYATDGSEIYYGKIKSIIVY